MPGERIQSERVDVPRLIGKLNLGREPDDPTAARLREVLVLHSKAYGTLLTLNQDRLVPGGQSAKEHEETIKLHDAVYDAHTSLRSVLTELTSDGVVGTVELAVSNNFLLEETSFDEVGFSFVRQPQD